MTLGGAFTLTLVKDKACHMKTPCPSSNGGSTKCVVTTVAVLAGGAALAVYLGYKLGQRSARVNNKINLSSPKVADAIDIEDIGEKKAFCRCWKSEKWPYCDGAHGKHNKETGDNLGPVIIKGKPAATPENKE
ncbi:unnamed protein product [Caenorhabditis angaria]|uniref:CDGSH iron-sulfur domain-containing protein 2 homologue n=1 Tax=Caenorhabditis angaria TaxID=860376 RepID=A0A9P1I9V8_9PELO|nr:unnamed protein product [Caenorhabditis angaria]